MEQIVSYLSRFVTETEYLNNIDECSKVSHLLLLGNDGVVYRQDNLSFNRSLRHALTGKQEQFITNKGKTELTEEFNFLPNGEKVPYWCFEAAHRFFLDVMEELNAPQEALIHVLWNPEQGYHMGVPTQTVSGASVSHNYDDLDKDSAIVLDIHSHNNMGAFFSSTDDRNDDQHVSISGVFGKLNSNVPERVWRFNNLGLEMKLDESRIFESRPTAGKSPQEWLDKVTVRKPQQAKTPYSVPVTRGTGWQWPNQQGKKAPGPGNFSKTKQKFQGAHGVSKGTSKSTATDAEFTDSAVKPRYQYSSHLNSWVDKDTGEVLEELVLDEDVTMDQLDLSDYEESWAANREYSKSLEDYGLFPQNEYHDKDGILDDTIADISDCLKSLEGDRDAQLRAFRQLYDELDPEVQNTIHQNGL